MSIQSINQFEPCNACLERHALEDGNACALLLCSTCGKSRRARRGGKPKCDCAWAPNACALATIRILMEGKPIDDMLVVHGLQKPQYELISFKKKKIIYPATQAGDKLIFFSAAPWICAFTEDRKVFLATQEKKGRAVGDTETINALEKVVFVERLLAAAETLRAPAATEAAAAAAAAQATSSSVMARAPAATVSSLAAEQEALITRLVEERFAAAKEKEKILVLDDNIKKNYLKKNNFNNNMDRDSKYTPVLGKLTVMVGALRFDAENVFSYSVITKRLEATRYDLDKFNVTVDTLLREGDSTGTLVPMRLLAFLLQAVERVAPVEESAQFVNSVLALQVAYVAERSLNGRLIGWVHWLIQFLLWQRYSGARFGFVSHTESQSARQLFEHFLHGAERLGSAAMAPPPAQAVGSHAASAQTQRYAWAAQAPHAIATSTCVSWLLNGTCGGGSNCPRRHDPAERAQAKRQLDAKRLHASGSPPSKKKK